MSAAAPAPVTVVIQRSADERLGLGCVFNKEAGAVKVSSLTGSAEKTRQLQVGNVIVSINGKAIKNMADVTEVMKAAPATAPLTVVVAQAPAAAPAKPQVAVKHSIDVVLEYEEGEPVGAFINPKFEICRLTHDSIASEKLQLGDKILQIGGWPLRDEKHFYDKLFRSAPQCALRVERFGIPGGKLVEATPAVTYEATKAGDHQTTKVSVQLKDGEPLGVVVDEALEIVRIQADGPGAKVFHVGDIIEGINGQEIMDINHFYELLDKAHPNVECTVDRSKYRESEVEHDKLPEEVEKLIQRRHGFKYGLLAMRLEQHRPYGLQLGQCAHNRVIVINVKEKSTAADVFKVYDRIIAINGAPVTDENVAREYISAACGNFNAVTERPADKEHWTAVHTQFMEWKQQKARAASTRPEDELPMDAILIAQAYKLRRRNNELKAAKSVTKAAPSNPSKTDKHLQFNDRPNILEIISDVPAGKQLRRCA